MWVRIKKKEGKEMRAVKEIWNNFKYGTTLYQHLYYRGARRREKGTKKILEEIIAKKFPNMGKNHSNPGSSNKTYRKNPRRNALKHILMKLTKIRGEKLKASREKQQITYKGTPIRLSGDFSAEVLQARRE